MERWLLALQENGAGTGNQSCDQHFSSPYNNQNYLIILLTSGAFHG